MAHQRVDRDLIFCLSPYGGKGMSKPVEPTAFDPGMAGDHGKPLRHVATGVPLSLTDEEYIATLLVSTFERCAQFCDRFRPEWCKASGN